MSIASNESRASRLSRLSRRSTSRRALSSEEIEQLQIALKRSEVQDLMKENAKSYRQAIDYPEVRSDNRSTEVTVPREFNLSRHTTPGRRCGSQAAGSDSEGSDFDFSTSLRRSRSQSRPRSARPWKPKLTVPKSPRLHTVHCARSASVRSNASCRSVGSDSDMSLVSSRAASKAASGGRGRSLQPLTVPEGPDLHTARRCRSASSRRGGGGLPSEASQDGATESLRLHLPPREQVAVERHLERVSRAQSRRPSRPPPPSAEERAERARAAAQARHEEALAEEKKRLCVFKPVAAGDR